jgi:hypothetical protein
MIRKKDTLEMNFFNVLLNDVFTGELGVRIESSGGENVGTLSNGQGNFNFTHGMLEEENTVTYASKYVSENSPDP